MRLCSSPPAYCAGELEQLYCKWDVCFLLQRAQAPAGLAGYNKLRLSYSSGQCQEQPFPPRAFAVHVSSPLRQTVEPWACPLLAQSPPPSPHRHRALPAAQGCRGGPLSPCAHWGVTVTALYVRVNWDCFMGMQAHSLCPCSTELGLGTRVLAFHFATL